MNYNKYPNTFQKDNTEKIDLPLNDVISNCGKIFSSLSADSNLKMFIIAKDGLRYNPATLQKLAISRKTYYKGLKALTDAGLITKSGRRYFHSTFGMFIFQRNILEISIYTEHLEEMKIIDTVRNSEKFSEDAIERFTQKLIGTHDDFLNPLQHATIHAADDLR
jgi:hypothetical protein